jgi:Protein of unknown function (DUF433)
MNLASKGKAHIIRTDRGLAIAGTRITLYDVMDYAIAQYPPKFIRGLFELTEEQLDAALAYIHNLKGHALVFFGAIASQG